MKRKYRFLLTAEIEVEAPNTVAADLAVRREVMGSPMVRAIGSCFGGVRLPSQRKDEPSCSTRVRVGHSTIKRIKP